MQDLFAGMMGWSWSLWMLSHTGGVTALQLCKPATEQWEQTSKVCSP